MRPLRTVRLWLGLLYAFLRPAPPPTPKAPSLNDFEDLVLVPWGATYTRERIEGVVVIRVVGRVFGDRQGTALALYDVEERARAAGYDVAHEPHALVITGRPR